MDPIQVGNHLLIVDDDNDPLWLMVADSGERKLVISRCRDGEWGEIDLNCTDDYLCEEIAKWLLSLGQGVLFAENIAFRRTDDLSDDWYAHSQLEKQLDDVLSDVRDSDDEIVSGTQLVNILEESNQSQLLPILLTRLIVSQQITTDNIGELAQINLDLI